MITLMKFSAEWCAPCKAYDPILTSLEESREDVEVVRIDIEESPDLASQFDVQSVPYTVFKKGDEILGGFTGPATKGKLNKMIDTFNEEN